MKNKSYALFTFFSLMLARSLGAQEQTAPPAAPDQGFIQTLVMIAIAVVFFYFILWRPEQKRRKVIETQRNQLKKGDRVAAMGILGTVVRVGDQTVILKMYDGTKLEFYKAAITEVLPETEEGTKKVEPIGEESQRGT